MVVVICRSSPRRRKRHCPNDVSELPSDMSSSAKYIVDRCRSLVVRHIRQHTYTHARTHTQRERERERERERYMHVSLPMFRSSSNSCGSMDPAFTRPPTTMTSCSGTRRGPYRVGTEEEPLTHARSCHRPVRDMAAHRRLHRHGLRRLHRRDRHRGHRIDHRHGCRDHHIGHRSYRHRHAGRSHIWHVRTKR